MKQVMTISNLNNKLAKDIMFSNTPYCRVQATEIKNKEAIPMFYDLHLEEDGEVTLKEIFDDRFYAHYSIHDDKLQLSYEFHSVTLDVTAIPRSGDAITHDLPKDSDLILLFTIFRVSDGNPQYIWPITYLVDNTNKDSNNPVDIINAFFGGKRVYETKYTFEQIMCNIDLACTYKYIAELDGNDADINEGFDIESTAEYFEVKDKVDTLGDGQLTYSWNPETKLLSINKIDEENEVIIVDLYYIADPENVEVEDISSKKKIFSYAMDIHNSPKCTINKLEDQEFYKDEHAQINYTTDDTGIITYFEYLLDGISIVSSVFSDKIVENSYMSINNIVYDSGESTDAISWTFGGLKDDRTKGFGGYQSESCSFTYTDNLFQVQDIKSYIYTFENLYARSIAYNLIKIC